MSLRLTSLAAVLLGGLIAAGLAATAPAAGTDEVLLLAFFRDNGQKGVYLAWSEDGVRFQPLNGDEPILKPGDWPDQKLTRDPSIVYHDGLFRAVWTTNWKGRCFGYAESSDLARWSGQRRVYPFPTTLPAADQPRNVWAPEITRDPATGEFLVYWSSTTDRESRNGDGSSENGKDGEYDHRIYVSRTRDGKTFSDARLFFDPKYCCIDACLAFDGRGAADSAGGRWVMVFKDERVIRRGGKNLRMTTAPPDLTRPAWEPISAPIAGPGSRLRSREMAEGPSLIHWKDRWLLYWDAFADGRYCLATSPDLRTWTDRTADLRLPPKPRHGTVFRAPRSAVAFLNRK